MFRLLCVVVVGVLFPLNLSPAAAHPTAARTPVIAENFPQALAGPNPRAPSAMTNTQLPPEIRRLRPLPHRADSIR